eukprot:scaffold1130_cov195-Pinguiococcus_pyrenoidosus.AAC.13
MRVLIVDAHHETPQSRSRSREEVGLVRAVLDRHAVLEAGGIAVLERRPSQLEDFLFETLDHEYPDVRGLLNFQCVDIVVVLGAASDLPWEPWLRPLCVLIKMCVLTNKCAFLAGLGLSLLCFVLGTGAQRLHVLRYLCNGAIKPGATRRKGRGSTALERDGTGMGIRAGTGMRTGTGTEAVIETASGDIFVKDPEQRKCWTPVGNVGLRHHDSWARTRHPGFRCSAAEASRNGRPTAEAGEVVASIKKEHLRDPLLDGISRRGFRVPMTPRWVPNEASLRTSRYSLEILADAAPGPLLIRCGRLLGFAGRLSTSHAAVRLLLDNFVAVTRHKILDAPLQQDWGFFRKGLTKMEDRHTVARLVQAKMETIRWRVQPRSESTKHGSSAPWHHAPAGATMESCVAKPMGAIPIPEEKLALKRRRQLKRTKRLEVPPSRWRQVSDRNADDSEERCLKEGTIEDTRVLLKKATPLQPVDAETVGFCSGRLPLQHTSFPNTLPSQWQTFDKEAALVDHDLELQSLNSKDDSSSDEEFWVEYGRRVKGTRILGRSAWVARPSGRKRASRKTLKVNVVGRRTKATQHVLERRGT